MLKTVLWLVLSLSGWRAQDPGKPHEWVIENGILSNGQNGKTVNLVTTQLYGDVEATIEFRVPKDSNSGVYFQGLYEIQILDSYGKTDLKFGDNGGIYALYTDGKTVGGAPPRVRRPWLPG